MMGTGKSGGNGIVEGSWNKRADEAERRGQAMQALVYRKLAKDLDSTPDENKKFGVVANLLDLNAASTEEWHTVTDSVYLTLLRRSGRINDVDWEYIRRLR